MLWEDIKAWLHTPFQQQLDPVNWGLLVIFTLTVAFAWSRVLEHVLEE